MICKKNGKGYETYLEEGFKLVISLQKKKVSAYVLIPSKYFFSVAKQTEWLKTEE